MGVGVHNLFVKEAAPFMVVYDTAVLQVGIQCDGTEILKASFFQIAAYLVGELVPGGRAALVPGAVADGFIIRKAPEIGIEGSEFFIGKNPTEN